MDRSRLTLCWFNLQLVPNGLNASWLIIYIGKIERRFRTSDNSSGYFCVIFLLSWLQLYCVFPRGAKENVYCLSLIYKWGKPPRNIAIGYKSTTFELNNTFLVFVVYFLQQLSKINKVKLGQIFEWNGPYTLLCSVVVLSA